MTTRLGQQVMDLLQQGREEAVAELAAANPRALRPLMGRLWDPDPQIRRRAAEAIGRTAVGRPELGQEMIRRLMWALNDEAATNGVYGIPALGEIGHRCPEMMAPFVPALVSMAWDEGIRLELLKALGRIAEADPETLGHELDRLRVLVDEWRDDERQAFRRLAAIAKRSSGEGA